MLEYPQYMGSSPMYHIGRAIVQNQIPNTMQKILHKYTIKDGTPILASKYVIGPLNKTDKTTNDAASAKLAILTFILFIVPLII